LKICQNGGASVTWSVCTNQKREIFLLVDSNLSAVKLRKYLDFHVFRGFLEEKREENAESGSTEEHYLHPSLLSASSQPVGYPGPKSAYFVIITRLCIISLKINAYIIQIS
jgi:hypothetical protein